MGMRGLPDIYAQARGQHAVLVYQCLYPKIINFAHYSYVLALCSVLLSPDVAQNEVFNIENSIHCY